MGVDLRVVVPNEFGFLRATSTNTPLKASLLDKLVQLVAMELLSTPGRDIFNLSAGAGLRQALPVSANQKTETGAFSDVSIALMRVSENIKARQDEEEDDPAGRLSSLQLVTIEFDEQNTKWEVIVRLTTEAGTSRDTLVSV
jgi:hypothetical protein